MAVAMPSADAIRRALPTVSAVEPLTAGGFKAVYKAMVKGTWEALKIVEIPTLSDAPPAEQEPMRREMRSRIFREIGILEAVQTPELVRLGTIPKQEVAIDGKECIAYSEELLPGCDLWQIIKRGTVKPSPAEVCSLFGVLLRAVKALWSRGYVHRDIKPGNVMRTGEPARPFVLMDLGIAFSIHDTALTFNAGGRLPPATYRYIDPEMLNPAFRDTIDFRSDLYTAAMTVYEYASFSHPLARSEDDLMTTLSRALNQAPKRLAERRGDLPPPICGLVDQMLKKKRTLRPANLDMLLGTVEGLL